jgi:hypothetical protein
MSRIRRFLPFIVFVGATLIGPFAFLAWLWSISLFVDWMNAGR